MREYELLDAVGDIRTEYIQHAARAGAGKKALPWRSWALLAAGLCLAMLAAVRFLPLRDRPRVSAPGPTGIVQEASRPEAVPPAEADTPSEPADDAPPALFLPPLELPEDSSAAAAADMIGLVAYRGGIYTASESYWGEDALRIDSLLGEYLGRAKGNIDVWSSQDEYAVELASNMTGDVYTVNGYDTDFRICVRREVTGQDGAPVPYIQFLDRLNGITLSTGGDLFESRLHLPGHVSRIQWQSHADWNRNGGNLREAELDDSLWEAFLDQVCGGPFVNTWKADLTNSVYDTEHQTHLILTMDDGTTVRLRLFEGGCVGYESLGWVFVQIPGDTFDAVFEICGGWH